MDKLLEQMAAQSPGIVACIVIVVFFLKHLQKTSETRDQMFKEMHADNLDARQQSREVLRDNTIAAKENTVAMSKLVQTVEQIKFKH